MKKFLVTILALVYLGSSIGATVNLHYCMGKLKTWDLFHTSKNTCGSCGMEKAKMGCCHDEQKQLHAAQDQQLTISDFQFHINNTAAVSQGLPSFAIFHPVAILMTNVPVCSPPGPGKLPIFVRCRNFRI